MGKEYVKSVYCHPAYYLTCRVHHPAGLDEVQSRIRISGRNINNLRYADDTTNGRKQSGTKEPLERKKSEKAGLKLNIQKTKIMASGPITSWLIDGEAVRDLIFLGSKITADGDCSLKLKDACCLEEKL